MPLFVQELPGLREFLEIVIKNLQDQYTVDYEEPQPVFDAFLAQFCPKPLDFVPITALGLEDAGDRAQDVGLIVGPLLELASVLLGSGIYYQHQGDLAGVEELEPVTKLLAGLFLDIFPRILLVGAKPSEESGVLYSRCVAEFVATLLTLLRLDEDLCAFTE